MEVLRKSAAYFQGMFSNEMLEATTQQREFAFNEVSDH